jgi:hypothetical protein
LGDALVASCAEGMTVERLATIRSDQTLLVKVSSHTMAADWLAAAARATP